MSMTRHDLGFRSGGDASVARLYPHAALVIRLALDLDDWALRTLAERDSARPLEGAVLVAVVAGQPWAAISLRDGRLVADPFRPSAEAAELLSLRARQLRRASSGLPVRRLVRRRRWAIRLPTLLPLARPDRG